MSHSEQVDCEGDVRSEQHSVVLRQLEAEVVDLEHGCELRKLRVFRFHTAASNEVRYCFDQVHVGWMAGHEFVSPLVLFQLSQVAELLVGVFGGGKAHRRGLVQLKVESRGVHEGLLERCVLEEEVVEQALDGVSPHQVHLGLDAHAAELANQLQELGLVRREVLQFGQHVQQRVHVPAKRRLSGRLNPTIDVVPILVEPMLFHLVNLQHSTGHDSDVDSSHNLLAVLHHDLLKHLCINEFADEPVSAAHVLVDIGLQVPRHVGQAELLLRPLLDSVVELDCELEDGKFSLVDLLRRALCLQVEALVGWRLNKKGHFRLELILRELWVEQVEVFVSPRHLRRDDVLCVPVQQRLCHEGLVVFLEEETDLPVAVVLPLNFLIQRV